MNAVTYANGLFVAVGDYGTVITTPDSAGYLLLADSLSSSHYFIFHIRSLSTAGLSAPEFQSPGFGFTFSGAIGATYALESSPDLMTWKAVFTFTNVVSTTNLVDSSAITTSNRFYRIVPQ
ncbi:MAG TPA: hypothetical protein VHB20_12470 [Verrucomicrobiae bacterium]|nr:hypothetical protein [Verrucomicrobiae bacterium]